MPKKPPKRTTWRAPRRTTRPFEIRDSPTQGKGAFATREIAVGVRLCEYGGEHLTPAEADARYPDGKAAHHHTFLFAIDDHVVVDAAADDYVAKWINHSCDPNCDAVIEGGRIWIETLRRITPGEELAYDYAYVLPERHTPAAKRRFPCKGIPSSWISSSCRCFSCVLRANCAGAGISAGGWSGCGAYRER